MAAGPTYTPITATTLGSAQATVTFNSFSGYTDLVLIAKGKSANSTDDPQLYFNSDTGSNYSLFTLDSRSGGTNARYLNLSNGFYVGLPGWSSSGFTTHIINIMNYANSTTYKPVILRNGSNENSVGLNGTFLGISVYRSTSAITSFTIDGGNGNIAAGSTFTLYGILAA